jgi:hypothetical protein
MGKVKCPFAWFFLGSVLAHGTIVALTALLNRPKRRSGSSQRSSELSNTAYTAELDIAIELAQQAGEKIKDAIKKHKIVSNKGAIDFVTKTDKDNEKLIFNCLKKKFPTHKLIGEV